MKVIKKDKRVRLKCGKREVWNMQVRSRHAIC